ncbi:MAG TPA: transglycosylase family protein [Solirubrobacteraceae bacterium]|nr:transglycosylase family protein [Solirubrobacteraceae bacterium]
MSVALAGHSPKLDHDAALRTRLGGRIVGIGLRRAAHDHAVGDYVHAERALARLRGRHAPHGLRAHAARLSTAQLLRREHRLRHEARSLRAASASSTSSVAVPAALQAIAACESGGDPHAIGGGGAYRGKYQFSYATWAAVGGTGDPAAAPVAEQDRRAAMLYAQEGPSQWPVCGR